jgi:aminodeoxyfutalosine synthase
MGLSPERIVGADLMDIYTKVDKGERLSVEDGIRLYETKNLTGVAYMANIVRERKNGDKAYFIRNQHINYTNICNKFCKFCSFYAKKGGPTPYEMSIDEVKARLRWHEEVGITEVHMVGGINPRLKYEYYMDLCKAVKEVVPGAHVKAFTAVEIVARDAASLNIPQYSTMLYGHIETARERVEHMDQLRDLQDEIGSIVSFTPLSFHPENTELEDVKALTGDMDLRNIAVSRLMLDNIDHIKSFWIMNTPEITQAALWYGADDCDGLVHEYEITYNEGDFGNKTQVLTYDNMVHMITEAGRTPIERDSYYNEIERSAPPKPSRKLTPVSMSTPS